MPTAHEIAAFANTLLRSNETPDYPSAVNGLQVETPAPITKIAAAVDFSARTVAATKSSGAQLLVVHHGAFWQGAEPITGKRYEVIASLINDKIGVYASHLPLDCHPRLGNNALLAKKLGLIASAGFAEFNGVDIGIAGESAASLDALMASAAAVAVQHGGQLRVTPHSKNRPIGRWAMCTGSGADATTLKEAVERGVNTLIVGEGPHWTSVFAEENGIVILYAGHYATETLGVQALASEIAKEFGIDWGFIPAPTGS
jgi:dinuclear metal center YbgI/SA1388 family protein